MHDLLQFIHGLVKSFGNNCFFDIILDENLSVLYFYYENDVVLNKVGIVYYKNYPLEIKFDPDMRLIWIDSKNSKMFERTTKKLSSDMIKKIELQIALS